MEQLVHIGLSQAEGHDVVGDDDFPGKAPEIGLGAAAQHGHHLVGRAGEHQHMDAVGFEGTAGGGAHGIVEHHAPLREHSLLAVVVRHGGVKVFFVEVRDVREDLRVEHQRLAAGGADGLLGEVVVGGAQAAGGDEDVRPVPGGVHRLAQASGVVSHHCVPEDVDTQGTEALGEHLGIGVGDVAQEQLSAYGNDFSSVCHDKRPPVADTNPAASAAANTERQRSISARADSLRPRM